MKVLFKEFTILNISIYFFIQGGMLFEMNFNNTTGTPSLFRESMTFFDTVPEVHKFQDNSVHSPFSDTSSISQFRWCKGISVRVLAHGVHSSEIVKVDSCFFSQSNEMIRGFRYRSGVSPVNWAYKAFFFSFEIGTVSPISYGIIHGLARPFLCFLYNSSRSDSYR